MCNNLFLNILDLSINAVFTATSNNNEDVVETDSRSRQCVCGRVLDEDVEPGAEYSSTCMCYCRLRRIYTEEVV
jgi:hypothetical protein